MHKSGEIIKRQLLIVQLLKLKRLHILVLLILLFQIQVFAQDYIQIYKQAKVFYEEGAFTSSIRLLKQIETGIGPTIKTQSLLVYNYLHNEQFIDAKIAIEKYKRLAAYTTGDAHQKLLQQEALINAGLRKLEDDFRNKEMTPQKKMQAARVAIQASYPPNSQTKTQKEIDDIRKQFETSSLLERKYDEYLKRITDAAATELKKKANTFSEEQAYFKDLALYSITAGNMTWTKENLKMTYFSDGTPIVMAKNEEDWINYFHAEIPCWRYHQYDPNQDPRLGLEYNMYVIMNEKRIAPECWRVPTINDWKHFSANIGDWHELYIPDAVFTLATKDGSKQYGAVYWNSGHRKDESRILKLKGKNKSGFSAIPNRSISRYGNAVDRNDNNKAVWWAMTPKNDWFKIEYKTTYNNLLEVRKDYNTEVAGFYFTNSYDINLPYSKKTIFIYWNFLTEDRLAKAQNRKPRYTDNIFTYDITKFNTQGQINAPESYERRSTVHMQGYPIRLVR